LAAVSVFHHNAGSGLQKISATLLLSVFLLPFTAKVGVWVDFKLNQDFIATVLCINKDEPVPMCNGNCYLSDQLQKVDDEPGEELPRGLVHKLDLTLYPGISSALEPNDAIAVESANFAMRPFFYVSPHLGGIFRPPETHSS
jgi:hypothetical protein